MPSGLNEAKQVHFIGAEDWGDSGAFNSLCSDFGFQRGDSSEEVCPLYEYQQQEHQQQSNLGYGLIDDLQFDMVFPPVQTCMEETNMLGELPTMFSDVEPRKEKQHFPFASLELLNNYGSGFKRLNGERKIEPLPLDDFIGTDVVGKKLSTEETVRVAGTRFIQSSSQTADLHPVLSHPFGFSFSGLSDEEIKDVELVEVLLSSAEKVGYQQFDRARKLLKQCDSLASNTGNPIQRVVFYFTEALRERIHRETGRITSKDLEKKQPFDVDKAMMGPNPAVLACHEELPFSQVVQFTGIQAIVENVAEAKKIHIIDFAIKNGIQWTVLMQALASRNQCPLELLKITAVGTTSVHLLEDTGKRLMSFAQTMNIPLSFKIVMVSDMLHLKEDLFDLDVEEAIAVYCEFILRSMIAQPDHLESVMKVIRNIYPCVMVVIEVEANHNSTSFVNRFTEALFYFSAFFDCLETFMKKNDPNRMIIESLYLNAGIRNIVATEGPERNIRHVKIDVWRAFFARFGMTETELSMSNLYQANLVVKKFSCGSSFTLAMNGKSLILGWKGAHLHSVSVWTFL
ncbi:DELLA protein [Quillaja saponaria]|uniref:DELLA protein n=1 Tax=Quillaja saponaria TaxID=32244 RepID=A0AAD7LBY7_QUISA|nr:DELLA protein [Quillaja saponaria]